MVWKSSYFNALSPLVSALPADEQPLAWPCVVPHSLLLSSSALGLYPTGTDAGIPLSFVNDAR